jgi:hypothetical protein
LNLVKVLLDRSGAALDRSIAVPGDDPDWSWALQSAVGWFAAALGRGTDGIAFAHADTAQALVLALHLRVAQLPATNEDERGDRKHPYVAAVQTLRGAAVELCILLVFWQSKNPESTIGVAPREAFDRAPKVRAILETELQDRSSAGWVPRAILGRRLTWLFYFGEDWLRGQLTNLFPPDSRQLRDAAWLAHLQYDRQPIGELTGALYPYYAEHIASLGREDAPLGYKESDNRLVEYLMILYLFEQLPEDLLREFWDSAPVLQRRHALWFMGRHMVSSNNLRKRAMSYWDRRLQCAIRASDPEPYRRELGAIGQFVIWDVDPLWLMDQLLLMLNAGFGPTEAMGVIDKLADQVPANVDKVVEIAKALVRHPNVEAWIFASQSLSLRKILTEGKKSNAPMTAASVKEIVSYLSARGNPSFLDFDE